MSKKFHLEIVTPKETVFCGEIISVVLPGEIGSFQVLLNHAPILSSLVSGKIKIVDENNNKTFYKTNCGFAEIHNNNVSIIIENVEKIL